MSALVFFFAISFTILLYLTIKGTTYQFRLASVLSILSLPAYRAVAIFILEPDPSKSVSFGFLEFMHVLFSPWGIIMLFIITLLRVLMKKRQEHDYKNLWRKEQK